MGDFAQLYLVVEVPADAPARVNCENALRAIVTSPHARGRLSAILLTASARQLDAAISPLVQLAQKQGIAVLVEGDARLARTVKADGMHIPASNDPLSAFEEAREILGARAIVGVDAGRSRHDAMSLGEAGADYIGFGLPARAKQTAADVDDDKAFRLDLVQWWSEIFEIPCVAFDIDKTDDAAELADARADFLAVRLPASIDAADAERWLQGFNGALAATTAA